MAQPSPLSPAWQRAQALADSGDLAGARAVLERALELGKVNLSEDDPDVLQTAYLLAGVHQRADDPSAARRVLEDAYAAAQWRLGDSDPLMMLISHDIGVVAEELGNRHEARKAFGRVAEFGPGVLGADHRAVARARAYLGQEQTPSVRSDAPSQPQAAPSTPYDSPRPAADPRTAQFGATPAPFAEPAEVPRTAQFGATPAAFIEAEPQRADAPPATPPRRDGTTDVFGAVPGAPEQRPGYVQPPSPANQQVWTGPQDIPAARVDPIDEATVAHPIITPRAHPDQVSDPRVPAPRQPMEPYFSPVAEPQVVTTYREEPHPQSYEKRGMGLFAAIAAVLAAVIAVVALVFVLANRSDDQPGDPNVPTLGGKEPTAVRLRDEGSKIRITWQDPSPGTVSFIVTMGHPGEQLDSMATLGPGQTSYELGALNTSLNYCFAVVAVYRDDQFATSVQVCTDRPAPSTSK